MRGQAATEYVLVSSVALLIIVPAVFFVLRYSQTQTQQFESSQVLRIGNRLALQTQTVFNGGKNTRTTLTERFPPGIVNITFMSASSDPGGEYIIYYDPTYSGTPEVYGFPVAVPVYLDTPGTVWGDGQRTIRLDVLENTTQPIGSNERLYVNVTVS